jgi:negative regulator of flagellin synthesis FlgM
MDLRIVTVRVLNSYKVPGNFILRSLGTFILEEERRCCIMRIDAYNQISQIYNTQTIARTNKSQTRSGLSDQVSISQTGRDYQVAKAAVSEASDIREDKVAQLKNLIDTGSYKVDEGDFASKLLASYGAAM